MGMRLARLGTAALLLCAVSARPQTGHAPVLTGPDHASYPPIARAAHVQGEAVVSFTVLADGTTTDIRAVSGPSMLVPALQSTVLNWRFVTPLPMDAETRFVADYTYTFADPEDNPDDDLDGPPPGARGQGDVILLGANSARVYGVVHSENGRQTIDVTPAPDAPIADRCTQQPNRTPPTPGADDFVEMFHSGENSYRVRIFRDGLVQWRGLSGVAVLGNGASRVDTAVADRMLLPAQSPAFWRACALDLPTFDQDLDPEKEYGSYQYFTARIGGTVKSVGRNEFAVIGLSQWPAGGRDDAGVRFAWAIDRAANTHAWIHGDAAREPFTNMHADLDMPKPGMTALIRATSRFSSATGQPTLDPLQSLLEHGVDVNAADESGWTALMYAAYFNGDAEPELSGYSQKPTAVTLLLGKGASPDRRSLHGDTALMMGAWNGVLLHPLLHAGADVNAQNAEGVSTLMVLAQRGDTSALKQALAAGADASAKDNGGRKALDYARAACHKPLLGIPEAPDNGGVLLSGPCSTGVGVREKEVVLLGAMKPLP